MRHGASCSCTHTTFTRHTHAPAGRCSLGMNEARSPSVALLARLDDRFPLPSPSSASPPDRAGIAEGIAEGMAADAGWCRCACPGGGGGGGGGLSTEKRGVGALCTAPPMKENAEAVAAAESAAGGGA